MTTTHTDHTLESLRAARALAQLVLSHPSADRMLTVRAQHLLADVETALLTINAEWVEETERAEGQGLASMDEWRSLYYYDGEAGTYACPRCGAYVVETDMHSADHRARGEQPVRLA